MDRIGALEAAIADQQRQLAEARAQIARLSATRQGNDPVSRREWFRRAALVSGAALATEAVTAAPAVAADNAPILAGNQTNAESSTTLFADSPTAPYAHGVLSVTDTNFVDYVSGFPTNAAVTGYSGTTKTGLVGVAAFGASYGVYAESSGGLGVFGTSAADAGAGVWGTATATNADGVRGQAASTNSNGVSGTATAKGSIGVLGLATNSATIGVRGQGRTAVVADGVSVGVHATGSRGATFVGTAAQLQAVPASGSTHPSTGHAGDFYVDSAHRLWFCRGGSTWVRLA